MAWREIADKMGIEIRYESKVNGFHGNEHHIEGVRVLTPDGEYDLIRPRDHLLQRRLPGQRRRCAHATSARTAT